MARKKVADMSEAELAKHRRYMRERKRVSRARKKAQGIRESNNRDPERRREYMRSYMQRYRSAKSGGQ